MRTFYVIPNDKELKSDSLLNPREVSDVVFMPLNYESLPDSIKNIIKIDPIPLYNKMPSMIYRKSTLSVWGFRHGMFNDKDFPICDTITTLPDSNQTTKNKYLNALSQKDLKGDSGAPVYLQKGKSTFFIGIEADGLRPSIFFRFPYWKNKNYNNTIQYIVSKSFIRYALERYVK